MTGYKKVNLKLFMEEFGEEFVKSCLSAFSCPLNLDVEEFLRLKAIDFAKQNWAQTHLVFASYKEEPVLVGYFTLASKYISVSARNLSKTTRKRISNFSTYNSVSRSYNLSAPLIAQLGKNYTNGYNKLITGNELLAMACDKVRWIQMELGGRFAYLECEDKPKLLDFYRNNGFYEFDRRSLDKDETNLSGEYLVQLLKYIK
ncbi:MAG: N-acetyltransferase [Oscillospiraceae bacterium]|nr:N-acetyltransferase [Oscillospiraceae bacterium]